MQKPARSFALLGALKDHEQDMVNEASLAAGVEIVRVETPAQLVTALDAEEPLSVIVATEAEGAFECCVEVRSRRKFAHVPIVGVGARRSNLSFVEIYYWGGDDVIALEGSEPLVRRLRSILATPVRAPRLELSSGGDAIVASTDPQWSTVLARSLANAGVKTQFVASATEALERAPEARVVIAADDLEPFGADGALAMAREMGIDTPFVIVAPPKRVPAVQAAVAKMRRVAVVDAFAPPENVLFVANDLSRIGIDQRAAARHLFGTTVSFRVAGRDEDDDVGFTYNVSATGIFVRTLAPIEAGEEIWLELWAPRSPRRVRLSGRVAWRRQFGPNETATVPPGFGVHLISGLGDDLDRWRAGCDALENDVLASSIPPPPQPRPSSVLSSLLARASV